MISGILFGFVATLFLLASFFAIKFSLLILQAQDAVDECLDVLDEKYATISAIAETPVAEDTPEIRIIVSEIVRARDSVLAVARVLEGESGLYNIEPDSDEPEPEIDEPVQNEGRKRGKLIR